MEITKNKNSSLVREVPVLSLNSYTEGSQNDQLRFIEQLFSGIRDYGFIILKDHNGLAPVWWTRKSVV